MDEQWTMNCILAGAMISKLLEQGKEEDVRGYLENLTSELTPEDINYLIFRLKTDKP